MIEADQILAGLWQGSKPPRGHHLRDAGFNLVVLCAQEYQPAAEKFQGVEVLHMPYDDNFEVPPAPHTLRRVAMTAQKVADALKRGEKVLVTCWAGLNRSGLVSGLALHFGAGLTGREATQLIQHRREGALSNPIFRDILYRVPHQALASVRRSF